MAYHLFEVYGIELEYMLVQRSGLKVNPIVDKLITRKNGSLSSDVENGKIEWSNELVSHVIELKTNGPTNDLENLDSLFAENVREINELLEEFDTQLLPTASHPTMDPHTETQLWQHHY
ncbi:MAG: glutamate--cysteine ligase, partial [Gramella sp.]|nr:glutamate--cysteine ligase [Christiangramia sp.]